MTDEQAVKMKKDLCDSVDALLAFSRTSSERMERLAIGAIALCAARFCASVIALARGDRKAMHDAIERERMWRLISMTLKFDDSDIGDDDDDYDDETAFTSPERN